MIKVYVNHARSRLTTPDKNLFLAIRRHFSIERSYNEWRYDARLKFMYLIDRQGFFPTGLLNRVVSLLEFNELEHTVSDIRDFSDYEEEKRFRYERLKSMGSKHRPYQVRAVKACLKRKCGTIYMATGTGKTYVMSSMCVAFKLNTLIICGKKDLAEQLRAEIQETIDEPIGLIGGGCFEIERVTVAIVASLTSKKMSKVKKKAVESLMQDTRVVLVDESHHIGAVTYQEVMDRLENAGVRLGFSASPFTSKIMKMIRVEDANGEDKMFFTKERQNELILQMHTGPVIYKYDIKTAIKDGYLATPTIVDVKFKHGVDRDYLAGMSYNDGYVEYIVSNTARNRLAASIIAEESKNGGVVVFVRHVDHGFAIKSELMSGFGMSEDEVSFAYGDLSKSDRKSTIDGFKLGSCKVLIGTSILSEGLNFLAIAGVNVGAGESDINVVQTLGRLLRKPRRGSDIDPKETRKVRFYDILDSAHPWFGKHSSSRRKMYGELGFELEKRNDGTSNR